MGDAVANRSNQKKCQLDAWETAVGRLVLSNRSSLPLWSILTLSPRHRVALGITLGVCMSGFET